MKKIVLAYIILLICFSTACKDKSEMEEINPLNRFTYKDQSYQTPKFGKVYSGELTTSLYQFDLVFMSSNHNFIPIEGVGYNITGTSGPIVFITLQSSEKKHIIPGTYSLSEANENRLIKALAVLAYTPPGSFEQIILLTEGEMVISELNGMIEINYEFNVSGQSPLIGYFSTTVNKWNNRFFN